MISYFWVEKFVTFLNRVAICVFSFRICTTRSCVIT